MRSIKCFVSALLFCISRLALAQEHEQTSESIFVNFQLNTLELTWIEPSSDGMVVSSDMLVVLVGVKNANEIKTIEVELNGSPIPGSRGFSIKKATTEYDQLIEKEILLKEGTNIIKMIVADIKGNKNEISRAVVVPEGIITNSRTDMALIIATDNYAEWSDLVNPINDAETIANELEKNYGFSVDILRNPSQSEILVKLKAYARMSYLPEDQLFIFIAGHGQFDDLLGQGYLVCNDSRLNDEARTTYLSHSILRNAIDNIPVQHILLAIDACFGGTFDQSIAHASSRGDNSVYSQLSTADFIQRKLKFKTRKYITSGGKEYVSDGIPGMHSPFARKFLEALRSYGGQDDILTLPELFSYVERTIPEPRAGSFGSDEPGSDFIFVTEK
jgi:hypothetical protein